MQLRSRLVRRPYGMRPSPEGLGTTFLEGVVTPSTHALTQKEPGMKMDGKGGPPRPFQLCSGAKGRVSPAVPRHPARLLSVLTESGAPAWPPPPSPPSLGEARPCPTLPVRGRCRVPGRTRPEPGGRECGPQASPWERVPPRFPRGEAGLAGVRDAPGPRWAPGAAATATS